MKGLEQKEKTKKFIKQVKSLVDSGVVKNYAEIIEALNWSKTIFSNVLNGRANVPSYIYAKFIEVYGITVNEPDVLSIESLIRIDVKQDVILSTLGELLAHQRGQTVAKINADLVSLINQKLKDRVEKL